MIQGIRHAGIMVSDVEAALDLYCDLFNLTERPGVVENAIEGMKHAILKIGDQAFELIEPVDPEGALSRFLRERGEGLHHISLGVVGMEALTESLKAKGATVIERGAKFAFIHPNSTRGVLIELAEE